MKLNIIKFLITTLLVISAAFVFELIAGHIAHTDTTSHGIFSVIKWGHEGLSELHLDGGMLDGILVLISTMSLISIIILWHKLKK
ncbi:MAG: hypothetical protein ACL7BU_13645 [Candidatus Phlomobacter fragariae]